MKKVLILITLICLHFLGSSLVFADNPPTNIPTPISTPTLTSSPSATPTATPAHISQCTYLKITEGDNGKAPATVKFEAKGEDNLGSISTYHFYFGDGEKSEVMSNTVSHTYNNSGTYTARVFVRDSKGNLKTSDACEVKVTVQSNAVESHRSGCSDIFFESGNNQKFPSTLKVRVEGFDNKGNIQKYKVDFGNGVVKEQTDKNFENLFNSAGTYAVKAYILDSQGNWKGGDGSCRKDASILTETLKEQPKTGVPVLLALGMAGMGGSGVWLQFKQKKNKVNK